MAESRKSDSNVELNDTRINETSSPMYSHPESNYMKKLITITKNMQFSHLEDYIFYKKLFQDINANIILLQTWSKL
jgi:hypothetical protein